MDQTDVLIIGGGLAGLSTAWHLPTDLRVSIVERTGQLGSEASSQNAGMIRRTGEDPVERALAMRSGAFYREPPDDWDGLALSHRTGAILALARDPYGLHDAIAHLRSAGVRVEHCAKLSELAPVFEGSPIREGWFLPDERVADSNALLSGFRRGLRRHGRTLYLDREVTELWVADGRLHGVKTKSGPISANRVVLAAGAWSARLAETVGLHRPLLSLRRTILQTQAHPFSTPEHPWCWVDDAGIYVRPEAGGWLCSPCDESPEAVPETDSRGPTHPSLSGLTTDKLRTYFPCIATLDFRGGWTGLRTFAPDRRPLLGPDPELEGLWWATGLGGFGVSCSPAIGEVIAAWMNDDTLDWIHPSSVDPGRSPLKRWPIRPDGDHHGTVLVSTEARPS